MTAVPKVDPRELRSIHLFAGFGDDDIAAVTSTLRVAQLEAGERLFNVGEPARRFFYVRTGQIKLFRTSVDGGEKVIEVIRSGQTFAEAVMFMEQRTYPVSAEAIGPSELLAFDQRTMLGVLRGSTEACFRMMAEMSMRLHRLLEEIDKLTLHNATSRLISFLMQQAPKGAVESSEPRRASPREVQLTTPKNVIASRLSIQPETLSRILYRLGQQGLVEVRGQSIVLRDLGRLRELGRV